MLQLEIVSATLTLLEIVVMHVLLEPSISQLVKHAHVIPKDLSMPHVTRMEFVPAKILSPVINVKIALQNITTLPTPANLVSVAKMVLLTKTAMPAENVHVNPTLPVTNVMLLYLAIMILKIQKTAIATWKVLKMKLVMIKEDATVDVMSKETSVTNVIQNIMVSQHVMPVCVMNMVPQILSVMKLANVHVKTISQPTNAVNVLKVSLDIQIAKDVLVMQRDPKIPLVTLLDNVHAKLMLSERIVTNVLKDILAWQIVKLANVTWMDPKEKIATMMANALVRNTLLEPSVMNARLVTA